MNNEILDSIQELIEYEFDEPKLLRQAFTRKSYSQEHNGAYNNEVLEFYGDKVLDFIVMQYLSYHYGDITQNGKYASQKSEGELTEIKKKLVSKKMLARRIDALGFADYILMGKGDVEQNAQNQDSVKEDLFEAILGAVAIDCDWDVDTLKDVVDCMINIPLYLETGFDDSENYVDLIQTWCQKKYGRLPQYTFYEDEDGYDCNLYLSEVFNGFGGSGSSKREARMSAAQHAYEFLEEGNNLYLPIDEVGEPDLNRAINQLQELYQKGYIGEPYYEFDESYDEDGNPVWRCECYVCNKDFYCWAEDSSKKNAKKRAAYEMLCDELDWEE